MIMQEQRRHDLITKVKLVLATVGVQPQAYAKALSSVIGVAIAQAYRKLNGASAFTLPQIEAIEIAYGVELLRVQLDAVHPGVKGMQSWTKALFVLGSHRLPCQIRIGAARKVSRQRFAAFLRRGEWHVCLRSEYAGTEPLFAIDAMTMVIDEPATGKASALRGTCVPETGERR
ncbi:helix-turn-helix domain-containing protein [Massilia sp. erpn]|uniref:helix-turn-helix domain-containing protein n=1 Tax=Massilia sp. erpn TaxID=2738142 RepID=UPI0021033BFA|nr:helix-turn-helix domain-containing protein [Massilia sp. erpn]UTY55886.1 hypothetical protein HPQ68_00995 [Massilia sp. erpn]